LKSIPTYVKFEYCNIAIKFHRIDLFLSLSYFVSTRDQHRDSNESRVFCESHNGSSTQAICISMRIFRKQKNSKRKGLYFNKDREYNSDGTGKSTVNVCLA